MVIEQVKEVLRIEAEAILNLLERVGPEFERAVEIILKAKGRVILTGMGKSGLIARKVSATLNSTGTPSLFLHPAEAIHGDLGMVTRDDIVVAISNSGQTAEINQILPIIKQMGAKVISFTGDLDSPMAGESDVTIDVGVEREACPMGLAPTASTTAALAMGDALAVVLISARRFDTSDFRRFHPGGSLGERLSIRVKEVMLTDDHLPVVALGSRVEQAIREIDAKKIGAALVVDEKRKLVGIVTDGDLRRALLRRKNVHRIEVEKIMSPSPRTVDENQTAAEALALMELYGITHLCIVDKRNRAKGLVHLHDLLGREEFRLNGGFKLTSGAHRRPHHPA
ncbi:MAG: KpsF/GutQ family sugar-phosphate isomerase [Deltaproteobacteria bacterium]|nr:KpsF/GutQ family sugar-phosphate isomerase [Deltaproteobacteria bacterium]